MGGKHGKGPSRRNFMRGAVAVGALTVLGTRRATGQARRAFKAGLIGCGGRGTGAASDIVRAARVLNIEVRITALADAFQDRLDRCRGALARLDQEVAQNRRFVGFDGYRRLIDSDVDIVLMATPPSFRPRHFEAAINAGKHVFMEKPVAVDAEGCRKMLQAGELATRRRLAAVTGTIYRHHHGYLGAAQLIRDGAIGPIRGGTIYYCTSRLWARPRQRGWSDAEYLARNWANFVEMSGDHIVEQHVHTIDVLNWFMGAHPEAALGFGGRHRRVTGNQFDFFSNDYEYPGGIRIHSVCRQINGCWNRVNRHLVGQRGWTDCCTRVMRGDERVPIPAVRRDHDSQYVQEHVDMLRSILEGNPLNETRNITESTATAILGREAAYTGRRIRWADMIRAPRTYQVTAAGFETGNVTAPPDDVVPIPGRG